MKSILSDTPCWTLPLTLIRILQVYLIRNLILLFTNFISLLLMGFKLMAGAVASCALIGVAVGVGIIYGSLLISIGRNPSQRDELLRYAFIGFSLVEVQYLNIRYQVWQGIVLVTVIPYISIFYTNHNSVATSGDRFTGKTSIYINTIINQNRNNYIKSVEGFGCKRVLGV